MRIGLAFSILQFYRFLNKHVGWKSGGGLHWSTYMSGTMLCCRAGTSDSEEGITLSATADGSFGACMYIRGQWPAHGAVPLELEVEAAQLENMFHLVILVDNAYRKLSEKTLDNVGLNSYSLPHQPGRVSGPGRNVAQETKMSDMTTTQEIISRATITGNILRLPEGQLDRKVYQSVAKALETIGGKWSGTKSVMGFVFAADPTAKVAILLSGEKLISAKKEFQFFQTPDGFGAEIVAEAGIEAGMTVLEPEAGQGALVRQILKVQPDLVVDCFELMPENQEILKQTFGARVNLIGPDFMDTNIPSTRKWDRIIANPPFANNQDIDHVQKMCYLLAPKGVMISVMSPHWTFAIDRKCAEFRAWIERTGAVVRDVEPGTFKESGTNVRTVVVRITKPAA